MNGIEFFVIVVGLPVMCGTAIIITAMLLNAFKKRPAEKNSNEETRLIQEMHQSLIRMEKRIDALETIYFEMDRLSKGVKK